MSRRLFVPVRKDRSVGAWLALALVGAWPMGAAAYSSPSLYAADPVRFGGGGGRAFTGAPADGLDCAVCHRGGAVPGEQLRGGPGGPYEPGATYMFDLAWPVKAGLGVTVEAADEEGAPLGRLRVAPRDQLLPEERCAGGGAAAQILELGERAPLALGACGATRLRFQWTAPEQARPGHLYVAMVRSDGDGTPEGDGVRAFVLPLTSEAQAEAGCAVAPGGSAAGGWLWLLLPLLRRRRRWLALGTLGLLAGCARVQPHERGRLARPDMQLAPDPDLAAGSEHALEYREGAVGGLGGGGGGCGCN